MNIYTKTISKQNRFLFGFFFCSNYLFVAIVELKTSVDARRRNTWNIFGLGIDLCAHDRRIVYFGILFFDQWVKK